MASLENTFYGEVDILATIEVPVPAPTRLYEFGAEVTDNYSAEIYDEYTAEIYDIFTIGDA